jgi:beta-glucuronidase
MGEGFDVRPRIPASLRSLPVVFVVLTAVAILSGSASNSSGPIHPIPASVVSLNGEWVFSIDERNVGEDMGWAGREFDDSSWMTVVVPHTWGVMPEYADYDGIAWYRRTFSGLEIARDAHVRLVLDAVSYKADVWLNGVHLGSHEGGYTAFEFAVDSHIDFEGENVLVVRVDNLRTADRIPAVLRPGWSFDWWNWGGIVRSVSLEVTSRAYVERHRVVATPTLTAPHQADRAELEASIILRNTSDQAVEGILRCDVVGDSDDQAALGPIIEEPVTLGPGESREIRLATTVDQPVLWHFDHPYLYRWRSVLVDSSGQVLDRDETTFGIRKIELKDAQFILNGEPMRLVGLTRHADSPEHGLAETVAVMARDYDDLKRLNMVFSRPVHYPQHEFILDYCDRNGILLIPEVPAWQLTSSQMADRNMRDLEKQQLREMIDEAFNHPSVWAWSVGNEYESKTLSGSTFTRDMIEYVKSLDPTRPVGFASNHLDRHPILDATKHADFVLMNQYFGTWVGPKTGLSAALDAIHDAWPEKPVFISEFGFEPRWNDLIGRPTSSLDPDSYYILSDDLASDSVEADAVRQQVIQDQMEVFRSKRYIAGAIFWTYQDYRTPSGFVMGVVDAERVRRGAYEVLREEYSPVLVQSVAAAAGSEGGSELVVALRTRGLDDIPSYTLSGYSLLWSVSASDGDILERGEISLPVLEPGCEWEGTLRSRELRGEVMLVLRIMRPTGHEVLLQEYDSRGRPIGRTAG